MMSMSVLQVLGIQLNVYAALYAGNNARPWLGQLWISRTASPVHFPLYILLHYEFMKIISY